MSIGPGSSSGFSWRALGLLSIFILAASCQPKAPLPAPALPAAAPAPAVQEPLASAPPVEAGPPPAKASSLQPSKPEGAAPGQGPQVLPAQGGAPAAILGQASVFSSGPVKGLLRSGQLLIASGDDSLVGLDARLDEVWRLGLRTSVLPVLSKGLLYVSGEEELVLVDAATGMIHARGPALGYGAKLAAYPGGVVASGLTELTLVNSGSAETGAAFPLEGGSVAAVLHGRDLLVARAVGGLALVDPETGAVKAEAPGPISPWLMVFDDLAVLAGLPEEDGAGGQASTGGLLAVYSLPSLSMLWSSPLNFTPQAEPAVGSSGIFIWGQGYLQQFSLSGQALQEKGAVCSPPLLTKGGIFYGLFTGHLIWAGSDRLQPKAFLRLPAALSARPIPWDGELRLPLVDGSVLSLDPGKMEVLPPGDQRF